MTYERPNIEIVEVNMVLLQSSEIGPDATSIGSPSVSNEAKSVWDEDNEDNETIDYEI